MGAVYRRRMRLLPASVLLVLLCAGCGDDGDDEDSKNPFGGGPTQECADLEGETMPEDFGGCVDDGNQHAALGYDDCDDGRALWISGPVAGFVGEPIIYVEGADGMSDPTIEAMWNECYGY
jgi:hypothetical protein